MAPDDIDSPNEEPQQNTFMTAYVYPRTDTEDESEGSNILSESEQQSRARSSELSTIEEELIRTFYQEEIEPMRTDPSIGYHRAFADFALSLAERLDTIPSGAIENLDFRCSVKGPRNITRHVVLDAYYWDESAQVFYAYIILFNSTANWLTPLDTATLNKAVSSFDYFIENIPQIAIQGDKTCEGCLVAKALHTRRMQPREYRLTVVSDMIPGARLAVPPQRPIGDVHRSVRLCTLKDLYDLSSAQDTAIEINFSRDYKDTPIQVLNASKSDKCKSYLCAFPGAILGKIFQRYSARLLEGNVRVFLGLTKKINREMKNTILNEPELVFAFNNGLSVTAVECLTEQRTNGIFLNSLRGMKIVNGGQTTATIGSILASSGGEQALQSVYVPMKITVVDGADEQELVPRISQYANSQNAVSKSAFESNSQFQIQIDRTISTLHPTSQSQLTWFYERLEGAYRQAASMQGKSWKNKHPKECIITKEEFTKYMALLIDRPDIAAKGKQKCFMETLKQYDLTAENIKSNWENIAPKYGVTFVKKVLALAIFNRKVVMDCKARGIQCAAAIALYTLAFILYKIDELDDYVFPYDYVWNQQAVPLDILTFAEEVAQKVRDYLVADNHVTSKGKSVLIPTEWAKAQECWREVQKFTLSLPDTVIKNLMPKKAWDVLEKTSESNCKNELARRSRDKLANLGILNFDLMLDYATRLPIGFSDEELDHFKQLMAAIHKHQSVRLAVKKDKDFEFLHSVYTRINDYDPRIFHDSGN